MSSSDSRQDGFHATITSIGNKYITVATEYGRKYKFDKEHLCCVEWCIYHLEESESSYQVRKLLQHKLLVIRRNEYRLNEILSDNEIDEIYNKIVKKFGDKIRC